MKTIDVRRVAVLTALVCSLSAWANPNAKGAAQYPLSCNAASKPLVLKGWEAMFNSQRDQARESLKQAVAADPTCALAKATLATLTPGAGGLKLFDEALAVAPAITQVERLDLQAMQAARAGDPEKSLALIREARELAPRVYFLNLAVAHAAMGVHRWAEASEAAKWAAEVNPKGGAAWNLLGYAALNLHHHDEAVAAFRKYAQLAPSEPNAHDSLADALLANNQLDDAAAAYQKAIDTSGGKFAWSYDGLATVRVLRGDYEGARAALAKQKDAMLDKADKVRVDGAIAWTWLAQGRLADALKALDGLEFDALAARDDHGVAAAPVLRGHFALAHGKFADALEAFSAAERVKLDSLTDGQKKNLVAYRLVGLVEAYSRTGRPDDARQSLTALQASFKATPGDPSGADYTSYATGLIALGKKDPRGAVEALTRCSEQYDPCRLTLADAQELAGDGAAAKATRTALLNVNHRDPTYWFVHSQVKAKLAVPGKKVAVEKTP